MATSTNSTTTTRTTIACSTWGARGVPALGIIQVRVDPREWDAKAEATRRSIARRTGLDVVTMRQDGISLEHGQPESAHYELTLGRRLRAGGWSVDGRIWVAIPVGAGA